MAHNHKFTPAPPPTRSYRVLPGQVIPSNGVVYAGGDRIELPPHIAAELGGRVEQIDAAGNPVETTEKMNVILDELKAGREHERVSILERELGSARKTLADIECLLAEARAQEQAKKETHEHTKAGEATVAAPQDKPVEVGEADAQMVTRNSTRRRSR